MSIQNLFKRVWFKYTKRNVHKQQLILLTKIEISIESNLEWLSDADLHSSLENYIQVLYNAFFEINQKAEFPLSIDQYIGVLQNGNIQSLPRSVVRRFQDKFYTDMLKHSSAYAYHSSALQLIDAQIK
jgi:hypothetical protein